MCMHLYEEFLCQHEFQLRPFLDNIKSLKQSPGDSCVLILSLTFRSNCVVLDRIKIWSSNDLCSFRFFLWLLLIPFVHVKERRMKNWKKVLAKKPKDEWGSHVTGKRSVSKYRNRRTTKLLWAMGQRKYFRTNNKNNLDIDSYVRCLTQRNYKGLKAM